MVGTTNMPAAVDSHSGGDPFGLAALANQLSTRTPAAHDADDTTIIVTSNTGFATRGILVIGLKKDGSDSEVVTYTGLSGSTGFTGCVRGADGTVAVAHPANSIVASVAVARNFNDLAAGLVATENEVIRLPRDPLVINGNMDHFERVAGASQTSTTTFNQFTSFAADRMFVRPAGASVAQARTTTIPDAKSRYSLAVTGAASVTTVDVAQRIEAAIVATRAYQSLVFSAYVFNNSGADYVPLLRVDTPATADNYTTPTNRLSQALQTCANGAWTRVSWVFDPTAYTNLANGMEVYLRIPSGSSVAGDVNIIAQFDLRPGIALGAYVATDPFDELPRCRRYRWVAPAGEFLGIVHATDARFVQSGGIYSFPVPLRVAPTVSGGTFSANTGNPGTFATTHETTRGIRIYNSASDWTLATTIITLATAEFGAEIT